ncbi:MAG: rhomboid family intramembrane serine protease, partial [Candidatus Aenigmarchaeota archaeon]|nr:rhomboid family intramembrane serine protease [Candidatus Aenigmarchaeota archaeon]
YLLSSIIGLLIGYPPNVSHIAHIGGAFVGLFYGFKVKGFRKGLRILIGIFIISLVMPFIWNFWVLITKAILGIF